MNYRQMRIWSEKHFTVHKAFDMNKNRFKKKKVLETIKEVKAINYLIVAVEQK